MRSDTELLDAWAAGDEPAGRELYARWADRITRFFARKIDDEVADLVHRTFLKCLEARRQGTEVTDAAAMLFAIARNELYDAYARRRRDRERFCPEVISLEDLGTAPPEQLARHEQQRLLLAALRRVPLDDQIALELYYWEDLGMDAVARVLGIGKSAALSRVHRARERVRERLGQLEASPGLVEETRTGFETWARSLHVKKECDGSGPSPSLGARGDT